MRRFHFGVLIVGLMLVATVPTYAYHGATCLKAKTLAACTLELATFINQHVDTTLRSIKAPTQETTKVVPILDLRVGGLKPAWATIGAAQVTGPAEAVRRVRAVTAFQTNPEEGWSIRYLVPTDNREPWKQLRRVVGVGVSAIVMVKECNAWPELPAQGCR